MPKSRALLLSSAFVLANADVYMQYPPGSNNRLDEGGGNRNNNNRLMDTQNNAKGGYGYGGSAAAKGEPLQYMTGSQLSMAWTSQHSCGSENAECQVVVQYMCNDGSQTPAGLPPVGNAIDEGPLRDGTDGDSPDPNNPDGDRGLHEPASFYKDCDTRERNQGLYTADQNLNGNDARRTRQNSNGARSGLECPEERDYYPYWHPSPWRDLAVLTNNLPLCAKYKEESQNVKAKNYCSDPAHNNAASCQGANANWLEVAPFGIAAPECIMAPFQRDNHLGNAAGDVSGSEVMLNITIPDDAGPNKIGTASNCAVRLRYNITTADTRACENSDIKTKAACEAAGLIWSASFVDSTYNAGGGQDAIIEGNPTVNMNGMLAGNGGTDSLLELAVNTNQYGRTFQDRSHVFSVQERPAALGANTKIMNLNVKGKRGNIVQTYPATEYDFHPVDLVVGTNDYVHVQWTGNDNTNNNGNNNGEGTDNEDRHNIVQVDSTGLDVPMSDPATKNMFDVSFEWNPESGGVFAGSRDTASLQKQFALAKQENCLPSDDVNNDQQAQNCEKLNAAKATVNLGMLKFRPGEYKYYSTRNNNFSNRAQKAKITTIDRSSVPLAPPSQLTAQAVPNDDNAASAKVFLEWSAPGSRMYADSNGDWVNGQTEAQALVMGYAIQYSPDGGENWYTAQGCSGTITTCMVESLPAGTPVEFRIRAAGAQGGWSDASQTTVVKTIDTDLSISCRAQLLAQAEGSFLTTGGIVAIVFGVFVAMLLLGCVIFLIRRRQPPPPPPASNFKAVPEYQ